MDRRHFLSVISAGAVGSAFLRFSWADEAGDAGGDAATAARKLAVESLARAKEHGKPLLVLVVPKDPQAVWSRGDLFGSWLAHADDALLADLALFELACLPMSALEGSAIRDFDEAKEPLMLCIETHEETPRAIAIDGEVSEDIERKTSGWPGVNETSESTDARSSAAIRERDALVSKWLRDAVKLDERMPSLAEHARAALTEEERATLAKHAATPSKIEAALLLRGAAVLRQAAKDDTKLSADAITQAIAKAAGDSIKVAPPNGALWAQHSGCGFEFEDPSETNDGGVDCGMGFVPKNGKRFLYFLVQRRV